jgi:dephospho-CoA kinase
MLIVGLTGGIASGKTTVADLFVQRGVPLVDADVSAREVVSPGSQGLAAVVEAFGTEVLAADGHLDRRALRQRVFADPQERRRLEAILHPLIRQHLQDSLRALSGPYALLVAPLLLEGELSKTVHRVLVVDVPEEMQIRRVMMRDGSSRQEAEAILNAQMSRQERLRRADDVIVNDNGLDALEEQVERLHQAYLRLANSSSD